MPRITISFDLTQQQLDDLERESGKVLLTTRGGWKASLSAGGRSVKMGDVSARVTGRKGGKRGASSGGKRSTSLGPDGRSDWVRRLRASKSRPDQFAGLTRQLNQYNVETVRLISKALTGFKGSSKKDALSRIRAWRSN